MPRLNQERQSRLEPTRMATAKEAIEKLGFEVREAGDTQLVFSHKGNTIRYFPYSGWATGWSIKDGRGLKSLLKQLKTLANNT